MKKTKLVLSIAAATLATAVVSQPALAGSRSQHHAEVRAMESKVDSLEAQLRAMQDEMASLRASAGGGADSAKVQELDAWMQDLKARPQSVKHDNTIFFRGGFASNDHVRDGVSIKSDVVPIPANGQGQADKDAWYIGAGFDFGLTDDVWGMIPNTEVLAELMFEYKEFDGNARGNCIAQNPTCLAGAFGGGGPLRGKSRSVTVNQLTLTAAPKIKFLKGSPLRPWVIPFGLGLHVISPPSESITVLNPGIMFAAGADYRIWKDITVGVDGRYHLTGSAADGVNTDGFTAGGYLGIGF
jgi:outer membrane murein-binding lipoprotein Lpp